LVAGIADYAPRPDDLVICAIGDPGGRREVVERLERNGVGFTTFVHDAAIIGPNVQIGAGGVICPHVVLTCDISLDAHVHINVGSTVGHDGSIGAFTTLSVSCNLAGGVSVESDAFLATGVTVIPGRHIGQGSYVGAGSVVVRNVRPHVTVFGNPATKIGDRS
jgi:sugar O-acyltransferase (sialic acid O-acetyltransferase NeuD family)